MIISTRHLPCLLLRLALRDDKILPAISAGMEFIATFAIILAFRVSLKLTTLSFRRNRKVKCNIQSLEEKVCELHVVISKQDLNPIPCPHFLFLGVELCSAIIAIPRAISVPSSLSRRRRRSGASQVDDSSGTLHRRCPSNSPQVTINISPLQLPPF